MQKVLKVIGIIFLVIVSLFILLVVVMVVVRSIENYIDEQKAKERKLIYDDTGHTIISSFEISNWSSNTMEENSKPNGYTYHLNHNELIWENNDTEKRVVLSVEDRQELEIKLDAIINDFNLKEWEGEHSAEFFAMDMNSSFIFKVEYIDDTSISCKGYFWTPENVGEVLTEVEKNFAEYIDLEE